MADALSASGDLNAVNDVSDTEYLNPVNDFFDPEELRLSGILKLLNNAYMDARIEDDSVYVDERRGCWITPEVDNKRILLIMYFKFNTTAAMSDKLEFVNRVNDVLPIIRAYISNNSGNLVLDWYLSTDGGITRRSLVYSIKRFVNLLDNAIDLDTTNVL